jgi:hypothetical protein
MTETASPRHTTNVHGEKAQASSVFPADARGTDSPPISSRVAHESGSNRTAHPHTGDDNGEKKRADATERQSKEQEAAPLDPLTKSPGPGAGAARHSLASARESFSNAPASDPGGTPPNSIFDMLARSAADGIAWCDQHPEDTSEAIPPASASSPSAATLRVQAGVHAALVGWLPKQGRR